MIMLLLFVVFLFVVDITIITISFFFILSGFLRIVIVISAFIFISLVFAFDLLKLLMMIHNGWMVERAKVLKVWPNILHLH